MLLFLSFLKHDLILKWPCISAYSFIIQQFKISSFLGYFQIYIFHPTHTWAMTQATYIF